QKAASSLTLQQCPCPCHLPILAIVLAGTTAGAFIGEHWGIAALTLTGLFVLSVTRLLRAFKGRS
ncbi:TPA: broad-spectrum mercury transporter MerE, partial [Salmonella enterica]|nr:broad-spectrum mercury transporter MerE [Salmonella enterica]